MAREPWHQFLRIGLGLLTLAAVFIQLWIGVTENDAKASNFFSFFTIQSNLLTVIVLLAGGMIALRRQASSPGWDLFRGAVVAYMTTTGIVYAALLSGLPDNLDLTQPWVNSVLHQVMPIAMVVDWIISPPERRLTVRRALIWMIFPMAYLVYSLIRGPIVDWYPYPFLNPDEVGGYAGVVAYAVGIAALFTGIIWFVVAVGNKARDWRSTRTAPMQPLI